MVTIHVIALLATTLQVINCQTEPVANVQDAIVKLDENAVITCDYTLTGTRTFLAAQWYNSTSTGDRLNLLVNSAVTNPNGRYAVDTTQPGVANLTIANTVLSDDGYYLCRIVDSPDAETGEHFGKLTVQYNGQVKFVNEDSNDNCSFTLACSGEGIPEPKLYLYHNGASIANTTSTMLTHTRSKATEDNNGNYTCIANNTVGPMESEEIKIDHCEPNFHKLEDETVESEKTLNIELKPLNCNPVNFTYEWTIDPDIEYDDGKSTLKFNAPEVEVTTKYMIIVNVTNCMGFTTDNMTITVTKTLPTTLPPPTPTPDQHCEDWEIALIIIGAILGCNIVCIVTWVTINKDWKCWEIWLIFILGVIAFIILTIVWFCQNKEIGERRWRIVLVITCLVWNAVIIGIAIWSITNQCEDLEALIISGAILGCTIVCIVTWETINDTWKMSEIFLIFIGNVLAFVILTIVWFCQNKNKCNCWRIVLVIASLVWDAVIIFIAVWSITNFEECLLGLLIIDVCVIAYVLIIFIFPKCCPTEDNLQLKCWNNKHIGKNVEGEDQHDGSSPVTAESEHEDKKMLTATGFANKTGKSSSFKVKPAKAEISTDSCLQIDYTLATGEIVEHFDWYKCDKKGGNKKFIVRSGDANSRFTVADDGSLKIPKVKEDDDGHYCCEMKTSLKVLSFHVKFTVTNASKIGKSSSKKNKSNVEPAIEMEEGNTQRYKAKSGDLYTEVNLKDKKKKQVEPEKDPSEHYAKVDMDKKTKKPDRPAQVDKQFRNAEGLTYADLDLTRNLPKDEINHPDPETPYASIQQQPSKI